MATYRNISLEFWSDRKVQDEFELNDKYVYLYLLTNPATTIGGCYEISKCQFELDTKLKWVVIEKTLNRLDVLGVIKYSKEYHEVLILNWGKYNWSSSPTVKKAIIPTLNRIKNPEFRKYVEEAVAFKFDGTGKPIAPDSEEMQIVEEPKAKREKKSEIDFVAMVKAMEFTPLVEESMITWLEYKKERKDGYNSQRGFQIVLNKVKTNFEKYGENAVADLINLCIERNWKGIIWEQIQKKNTATKTTVSNRLGALEGW